MEYFNPLRKDNQIYSCDMVRIAFCTNQGNADDIMQFINFECACRTDVFIYPTNTQFGKFKQLVKFVYDDNSSMTCGFGFNGAKREDMFRGFVELNPNKLCSFSQFWTDYNFFRNHFGYYEVPRVDIAVDLLGVKREDVFVRKDNRKYELKLYSAENKTEYLGVRNSVGRVKIYNKTKESGLDEIVTRIEITTEPNGSAFMKHIPQAYNLGKAMQQSFSVTSLCSTDCVLLELLFNAIINNQDYGMSCFNRLGRDKKAKLKPFLLPDSSLIKYDLQCVDDVLGGIKKHFNLLL